MPAARYLDGRAEGRLWTRMSRERTGDWMLSCRMKISSFLFLLAMARRPDILATHVTALGPGNASTVQVTRHQQIGVKLLAIIGFTPYYWQLLAIIALLAIIFLQKVFILLAIIATSSNINYCNYCDTIIAIIVSARNYWHYWQLLAIIDINLIIGINLN